jgi:hypothetical protein
VYQPVYCVVHVFELGGVVTRLVPPTPLKRTQVVAEVNKLVSHTLPLPAVVRRVISLIVVFE